MAKFFITFTDEDIDVPEGYGLIPRMVMMCEDSTVVYYDNIAMAQERVDKFNEQYPSCEYRVEEVPNGD